jgi:hypothetical protein
MDGEFAGGEWLAKQLRGRHAFKEIADHRLGLAGDGEDAWCIGQGIQPADNGGAIDARQPDIDDDRVIAAWNASGEKALRVVETANHMAQLFHKQAERIADGCIVFEYIDRQKPGAFAWTAPPESGARPCLTLLSMGQITGKRYKHERVTATAYTVAESGFLAKLPTHRD